VAGDTRTSVYALAVLAASVPAYLLVARLMGPAADPEERP
jgi:hypothetical protein